MFSVVKNGDLNIVLFGRGGADDNSLGTVSGMEV